MVKCYINKKLSIVYAAVIISLSGCSTGPIMHSQDQSTDQFAMQNSLFGDHKTSSNKTSANNVSSGKHIKQHKFVKATQVPVNYKKSDHKQVKYIAVPGQLKPIPNTNNANNVDKGSKKPATELDVINQANKDARVKPSEQGYFNSVMNYEYMPGSLYVVYTAPLNITDIAFQPGERIISYPMGDTSRWYISKTHSGDKATLSEHLIVKPKKEGLENTLLVTTDKRVYHIVLFSTHNNTYMVSVKWNYDDDFTDSMHMSQDISGSDLGSASSVGEMLNNTLTLDIANLNFNYKYGVQQKDKAQPDWFPLRVFSSNRQTFVEFKKEFKSSELPMLYVESGNNQYGTMVNWRLIGRFMVIDQVVDKAQLMMGVKTSGQTSVLIEKTS